MSEGPFLSRWSRLKRASQETAEAAPANPAAEGAPVVSGTGGPARAPGEAAAPAETSDAHPLPPVESLDPDSDFTPFMGREVDPDLRRKALKMLFQDARYNVMDGLDVYIDDYSKPDPLPEGWLEKMNQVARLGIFRPQEPDADPKRDSDTAPGVPALSEKAMVEQPIGERDAQRPSDTSGVVESSTEVPKS